MSDCLVWRSFVPRRHKQFSRTRSEVTEYKGHLQLKRSTTVRHLKTMLLCPTCSSKTHSRRYDDIDAEHDIETHHTSLAFYGYAHFSWTRELYVAVT